MSISEYPHTTVTEFGGQWTRPDVSDIPPTQALQAWNCEFDPSKMGTRLGFKDVGGTSSTNIDFGTGPTFVYTPLSATAMYNWINGSNNYLVQMGGMSWARNYFINPRNYLIIRDTATMAVVAYVIISSGAVPTGGIFTSGGTHLYGAFWDALSNGAIQGVVLTAANFAGYTADRLFMGPRSDKPTLSAASSGSYTTPGLHRVGYLIQSRSGYQGKISPVVAATGKFDITSSINVAAGKRIDSSLSITWPGATALVYPVMTTIDNLNRYFIVPGVSPVAVTGGTFTTVSFALDISDADLASTGIDVTDNQLFLTQDAAGAGPFSPFSIGTFGSRIVYLTNINGVSQAFASEPDNGQQITADQHVLYLPGQRQMIAQGELGRVLYILGPSWTYSFEDTGDVPVSWPSARLVDGSIGTLSPKGFTVNASTGLGWCASTNGLYLFRGGSYEQTPVSYLVDSEWKRINWTPGDRQNVAGPWNTVQVVDDKDKQRVYVIAPVRTKSYVSIINNIVSWRSGDLFPQSLVALNANIDTYGSNFTTAVFRAGGIGPPQTFILYGVTDTTHLTIDQSMIAEGTLEILPNYPTHILVFDYTNGTNFDKVKFSLWSIKGFAPGAGCIVHNPTSGADEFWVSQFTSAVGQSLQTVRLMNLRDDLSPHSDMLRNPAESGTVDTAIDWRYETGLMPGVNSEIGSIYHHYAQQLRVRGFGTLARTVYGIDRTKSQALANLTLLGENPGEVSTTRFPRIRSESVSTLMTMNAVGEWCSIAAFEHYWSKGPSFQ